MKGGEEKERGIPLARRQQQFAEIFCRNSNLLTPIVPQCRLEMGRDERQGRKAKGNARTIQTVSVSPRIRCFPFKPSTTQTIPCNQARV